MEHSPSPSEVLTTAVDALRTSPENPENLHLIRAKGNEATFLIENVPIMCRATESALIIDLWAMPSKEPKMAMLAAEAIWQEGRAPDYRGVADATILDRVLHLVDTELQIYHQFAHMGASSTPAKRYVDKPTDEDIISQMLIRLTYRWAYQVKNHAEFRGYTSDLPGLVVLSSTSDSYWNRLSGVWHGYLWNLEVNHGCLRLSISDENGDCLWVAATPDFAEEAKPEDWMAYLPRLTRLLEPAPHLYRFSTREESDNLVRVFAHTPEEAYQGLVATTGLPASQVATCYALEPIRADTRVYPSEAIQTILGRPSEKPVALMWTDDTI